MSNRRRMDKLKGALGVFWGIFPLDASEDRPNSSLGANHHPAYSARG